MGGRFRIYELALFLILFLYFSYQNAWLSDDAFISFRVVDHLSQGFGMRWNIHERVQVFTNPFLVLFLTPFYFVYKNIVFWSYASSFFFGLATFLFLRIVSVSKLSFWIGLGFLLSSRAFADYLYSGLENSLNYLIQAAFFYYYWEEKKEKDRLPLLTFLASLGFVSRIDFILIFLLPLAWKYFEEKDLIRKDPGQMGKLVLSTLPVWAWLFFSGFYFGSLLPNTYYAKMNVTDSGWETFLQGIRYYLFEFQWDPIGLLFPPLLLVLLYFANRNPKPLLQTILFSIPYLAYILYVGGDFMGGRFFTYTILMFGIGIVRTNLDKRLSIILFSILVIYNILFPTSFRSVSSQAQRNPWMLGEDGISDEKLWYYPATGIARIRKEDSILLRLATKSMLSEENSKIAIGMNNGFVGFLSPSSRYLIDTVGLCDPLLARIPGSGRVGHKERELPLGYKESVESGTNLIKDPELKSYYDSVMVLTRGELTGPGRWDLFRKFQFGELRRYSKSYLSDTEWRRGDQARKASE